MGGEISLLIQDSYAGVRSAKVAGESGGAPGHVCNKMQAYPDLSPSTTRSRLGEARDNETGTRGQWLEGIGRCCRQRPNRVKWVVLLLLQHGKVTILDIRRISR